MADQDAASRPDPQAGTHTANTISTRRLEAFTDGVFAIAATLLVLDLSIDKLGLAKNPTSEQVWRALGADWVALMSFGISFLLLCVLWAIHVRQFEYIARVDSVVIALNTFRLLGVVLVPFTTSFSASLSDTLPGRVLLPFNFLFVVALGCWQWFYASDRSRGLLVKGVADEYIRDSRRNALIALFISIAVAIVAPFVGSIAFVLFAFSSVFDIILRRRHPRPAKVEKTAEG